MQLHYGVTSPFARKVRVALAELGLDGEVALVETLVAPTMANRDYAAVHPLRQLPALVLADGSLLVDSTVILLYLDDRAGGGRLLPTGAERFPVLSRHALAKGAIEAAVGLRYETAVRPEALRWPEWIEDRWTKIDDTLDWFEAGPEPRGAGFDLAQISLACLLGYLDFRFARRQWRERRPTLAGWYAGIIARPSMQATAMPG